MHPFSYFPVDGCFVCFMLIAALICGFIDAILNDFWLAVTVIFILVISVIGGLIDAKIKEKNKKEYVVNIEIESLRKRREREKNNKCEDKEIDKEIKKENSEYDDIEREIEILREGNYDTETLIKLRNAEWARFKRELYDLLHIKRKKS